MICGCRPRSDAPCRSRTKPRCGLEAKEQGAGPARTRDAPGHLRQGSESLTPVVEAIVRHSDLMQHTMPRPGQDSARLQSKARQGREAWVGFEGLVQPLQATAGLYRQIAENLGL